MRTRVEIDIDPVGDTDALRRTAVRVMVLAVHDGQPEWRCAIEVTDPMGRWQETPGACWEENIPAVVRETAKLLEAIELVDPITEAAERE
jgi:hypothetical protein